MRRLPAPLTLAAILFATRPALATPSFIATAGNQNDSGPTAPRQASDSNITGSLGSHGSASAVAQPGSVGATAFFMNPITCACTPQGFASGQSIFWTDDIHVTAPAGVFNVSGVIHLRLTGVLSHGGSSPWTSYVEVNCTDQGNTAFGRVTLQPDGQLTTTGVLAGVTSTHIDATFDLPFNFAVGFNNWVQLNLLTSATGTSFGLDVNTGSADFGTVQGGALGGLHFATNGPAFSVPAGISINSSSLQIVENYWYGPGTASVTEPPAPDDGVRLAAAPNPLTSGTTLRYTLPRAAAMRLAIYDAQGRLVRAAEAGAQEAGEHTWSWDRHDDKGREVPAGVYFVRVAAEGDVPRTLRLVVSSGP